MSNIEVITSVTEMRVRIQRIIREAKECLYIISPYLKFDNEMKMLLEGKRPSNGINIRLVYGKKKSLEPETKAFLDAMSHIPKHFLKDLHAKCYLNEEMALVTSMNLYDYSMKDNVEMGIFVYNRKGFLGLGGNPIAEKLYKEIRSKAEDIIALDNTAHSPVEAEVVGQHGEAPSKKRVASKEVRRATEVVAMGHCIRCGEEIALDPGRPFCTTSRVGTGTRTTNTRNNTVICAVRAGKLVGQSQCAGPATRTHKEFVEAALA